MKINKHIYLLLIFILSISILISGCKPKVENEEHVSIPIDEEINDDNNEIILEEQEEIGREELETLVTDGDLIDEKSEKDNEDIEEKEIKVEKEFSETNVDTNEVKEETSQNTEEISIKKNAIKLEGKINEAAYTLEELKGMTDIIFEGSYYSLNNFGTTKHNTFKGVNLWMLLKNNGISSDASSVSIIANDGYEMEFTIDAIKKQDYIDETNPDVKLPIIIAWSQDGVEFNSEEGLPFKLIIGQKEAGDVNKPQWVSNIDKILIK